MTRQQILKDYRILTVRPAKSGELFMSIQWFNAKPSGYDVLKCRKTMKSVCVEILEKLAKPVLTFNENVR